MIKTLKVSSESIVKQSSGNIVSDMGGEKVMMSVSKGKYYNLGEIGGEIWSLIQTQIPVSQLVTALVSNYAVDHEQCEEQVISFLENLLHEGLIEIVS